MKLKRIFSFFISFLILVFISFESYAAVRSSSNAVMALPLDDDYGISFYSSIGTVTNTIDYSNIYVFAHLYDSATNTRRYSRMVSVDSTGRFSVSTIKDDEYIGQIAFQLRPNNLPPAGTYLFSFDFSSDFSFDYKQVFVHTRKSTSNASDVSSNFNVDYDSESGDLYVAPIAINLTNVSEFDPSFYLLNKDQKMVAGSFRINFTPYSGSADITTAGTNTTSQDAQIEISNNTTQLLNTSNSIYESLQDLIQHISNQLAALWDQMYNLMHVPTMAKLDEILSALRAIANNSDIYAVVEEIDSSSREQTSQIVQNANENTSKVEQAVEKHGNFIIEGLKGLFIPSDEYFKGYFDDLYTFFSDRFGFLSFPIDLLQRLADLFINSDEVDCVLTLPSFEISGEQLLIAQSFNLTEFLETNFAMLLSAIRIVGDCIIIGAFVNLCSNKWDEVMKN